MPLDRIGPVLDSHVRDLDAQGTAKGAEATVKEVLRASGHRGPRFILEGHGTTEFIRMNSNSYLGLSFCRDVIEAEERGARRFGAGPGAVRFISASSSLTSLKPSE